MARVTATYACFRDTADLQLRTKKGARRCNRDTVVLLADESCITRQCTNDSRPDGPMCWAHYTDEHDLGYPIQIYRKATTSADRPRAWTAQDEPQVRLHVAKVLEIKAGERKRKDAELAAALDKIRSQQIESKAECDERVRQASQSVQSASSQVARQAQAELRAFQEECRNAQTTLQKQLDSCRGNDSKQLQLVKAELEEKEREIGQQQAAQAGREKKWQQERKELEDERDAADKRAQDAALNLDVIKRQLQRAQNAQKSEQVRFQGLLRAKNAEISAWQSRKEAKSAAQCDAELTAQNEQLVNTLSEFSDILPYVLQLQDAAAGLRGQAESILLLAQAYAPRDQWETIRLESLPAVPSALNTLIQAASS